MEAKFVAQTARVEDDGYCTVICIADSADRPADYIVFQTLNEPTEQDIQLGQQGVHFQFGDQVNGMYDAVTALQLEGEILQISLSAGAAMAMNLGDVIEIRLSLPSQMMAELRTALERLAGRLE